MSGTLTKEKLCFKSVAPKVAELNSWSFQWDWAEFLKFKAFSRALEKKKELYLRRFQGVQRVARTL